MIDIDASDFDRFAGDLTRAVTEVSEGLPKVVGKGALNVKGEWNQAFRDSDSFKGIAGSVTYDTRTTAQFVEALVGPDKDRHPRAALANIAHFGGANGGGGTVADPQTFLDNEAEGFTKALGDLIEGALS